MISTRITTGSTFPDQPKQQPYSYGRREDGRWATVPYACLNQGQIDSLALYIDSLGFNYEVATNIGGRQEIHIDYPYNFVNSSFASLANEVEETWEMAPEKALIDLLQSQNPLVQLCLADISGNGPGALLDMQNRKLNNSLYVGSTDPSTGAIVRQVYGSSSTPYPNSAMQLFAALLQEVSSVEIPAPVVTRTRTVTASYVDPANFSNVGSILSTGTFISVEGVPSTVLFDFPSPPDPPPVPIGTLGIQQVYLYGWLKNSPSVRQITRQKWNIVQTWSFGLYLINLYGGTRL